MISQFPIGSQFYAHTRTFVTVTNSPITSSGTITLAVNSINATKIGNGDVDNTELSYVNGVTSAIQTQIDTKASNGFSIAMAIAL